MQDNGIFEEVKEYPDPDAMGRFASLVGLDDVKERMMKEASMLLFPESVENWSKQYHKKKIFLIDYFSKRPPLFVFSGDVGTGKTALAESLPDPIARRHKIPATLYSLSLNARGTGAVGEMTTLLSMAFNKISQESLKCRPVNGGGPSSFIVLFIDEADALAQSRELSQMHHEDRAGVNALIRGIDELSARLAPVIIIMCTNRISALDPAVKRRAAAIYEFTRPNELQREILLKKAFEDLNFSNDHIKQMVKVTGANGQRPYGFTYSDLTQRFLPSLTLAAYPDKPITSDMAISLLKQLNPTPPFKENGE